MLDPVRITGKGVILIYLNDDPVGFGKYPNGETLVPILERSLVGRGMEWKWPSVRLNYGSDSDLFNLLILSKYLDELGWGQTKSLDIPYFPYSRMDRVEGGNAFTLRYVADLINSLGFREIVVGEPHSDVTMAVLRNARQVMLTPALLTTAIDSIGFSADRDYLFFPDAGAEKRYSKLFPGFKYLVGQKVRDFQSGEIKSLSVSRPEGPVELVIMIDDLCSFGGTFIRGADALSAIGMEKCALVVAHCEESIFKGKIIDDSRFLSVFTTDSIPHSITHPKVKVSRASL